MGRGSVQTKPASLLTGPFCWGSPAFLLLWIQSQTSQNHPGPLLKRQFPRTTFWFLLDECLNKLNYLNSMYFLRELTVFSWIKHITTSPQNLVHNLRMTLAIYTVPKPHYVCTERNSQSFLLIKYCYFKKSLCLGCAFFIRWKILFWYWCLVLMLVWYNGGQ